MFIFHVGCSVKKNKEQAVKSEVVGVIILSNGEIQGVSKLQKLLYILCMWTLMLYIYMISYDMCICVKEKKKIIIKIKMWGTFCYFGPLKYVKENWDHI